MSDITNMGIALGGAYLLLERLGGKKKKINQTRTYSRRSLIQTQSDHLTKSKAASGVDSLLLVVPV